MEQNNFPGHFTEIILQVLSLFKITSRKRRHISFTEFMSKITIDIIFNTFRYRVDRLINNAIIKSCSYKIL